MTTNLFSIGTPAVKGRPIAEQAAAPSMEGDLSAQSSFLPMLLQMLFAQHPSTAHSAAAVDGVAIPIEQLEILDAPVEGTAVPFGPAEQVNALTLLSSGKSHMPVSLLQTELLQRDNQLQPKAAKVPAEAPIAASSTTPRMEETGRVISPQLSADIPASTADRTPLHTTIDVAPERSISSPETPLSIRELQHSVPETAADDPAVGTIVALPKIVSSSVRSDEGIRTEPVEDAPVPMQKQQPEKNDRLVEKKSVRKASTGENDPMEQDRPKRFDEPVVAVSGQHTDDENGSAFRQPDRQAAEPVNRNAGPIETKEFQRTLSGVDPLFAKSVPSTKDLAPVPAAAAASMTHETTHAVLEQITGGVAAALREGASDMKLVLRPEHLGEVTVRVQVDDGKVTATMDVQHVQVKQVIESNMPQLREALSQKGLTMERIEITAAQNGMADETAQHQHESGRQRSRRNAFLETDENELVKLYGYNTVEYTM